MELWFNCKAASREMTGLAIEDYMTLASLSYAAFKGSLPEGVWDQRLRMTKELEELEEYISPATYGRRSQIFTPMTHVKSRVAQDDVRSLYPYVMANNMFPMEEPKYTRSIKPKHTGIYKVDINRQPKINVLPLKDKGTYYWAYKRPFTTYTFNVSLEYSVTMVAIIL